MRKVFLSEIRPDMYLAYDLYHMNSLLLPAGTLNLGRYIPNFENLGIYSLYVTDELSEDIDIPDAVAEVTRGKCKAALDNTLRMFKSDGTFDSIIVSSAVDELIDDLLSQKEVLVSLNDIATTDDDTLVHSVNTTVYSLLIGKGLGLTPVEMHVLAVGSLLHDIGKTLIDPEIMFKPGRFTEEEFNHVKLHPVLSYKALQKNAMLSELSRQVALQHHERLDGSGYPSGLKGNEIHKFAKILAIADEYDALISNRCYRKALTNYEAYKILVEESNSKLNPEYLQLLLGNIAIYPNGSIVYLSDGTRGIVKEQNIGSPFRPVVRAIDEINGEVIRLYDVDLMKELTLQIRQ